MKLINSKVEILEQLPGYDGVTKQIEIAGRTCYKSEDKITEDSSKEFVQRMINSGHTAMLEHGTVYLTIPHKDAEYFDTLYYSCNKYSIVNMKEVSTPDHFDYFITTNLRVMVEGDRLDDLTYRTEPTEYHERRIAARFTCSRAIANEIVRHRVMSFAQESQRYCNYTKDKFANEITFIIPSDIDLPEGQYIYLDNDWCDINKMKMQFHEGDHEDIDAYLWLLNNAETTYTLLINKGWKPQKARGVLPNDTKTEIVVTGFEKDWEHFFDLRCAPSAHPDIQKLANDLYFKLYNKKYAK